MSSVHVCILKYVVPLSRVIFRKLKTLMFEVQEVKQVLLTYV